MNSFAAMQGALEAILPDELLDPRLSYSSAALYDIILRSSRLSETTIAQVQGRLIEIAVPPELSPLREPIYWTLMGLVGEYIKAAETPIIDASVAFLSGLVVREYVSVNPPRGLSPSAQFLLEAIKMAYEDCALVMQSSASNCCDKFHRKCLPWSSILSAAILEFVPIRIESNACLRSATSAVHSVYSCLQIADDWNDQAEDSCLAYWNLWNQESSIEAVRFSIAIVANAVQIILSLPRSSLRDVMALQLRDTIGEIAIIIRKATRSH